MRMKLFATNPFSSLKRHSKEYRKHQTSTKRDLKDSSEPVAYFSSNRSYEDSIHELETFLTPASLNECTPEEKFAYAKIAGLLDKSLRSFLKSDSL
ncbi:hypothetical protein K7432_009592 [Basidiobolus ranarum]|uniref:Uncharacterized protein n=1 Tax=Basidiobolus ranarum TaxID=34480 RepID=A0ABR2WQ08_9FUNG